MGTTAFIKRILSVWPANKIITTRDMLSFGSRTAVDNAVYRLIKARVIRRLVPGVFVLYSCRKQFSNLEVATVKAESFGRKVLVHPLGAQVDQRQYREGRNAPAQTVFGISGHSSSFVYQGQRIFLQSLISRKGVLSKTEVGRDCNLLWQVFDHETVDDDDFRRIMFAWKRSDKVEVARLSALLPAWIMDHLVGWIAPHVAVEIWQRSGKLEPRTLG